jgi:hypothetical protein
MNRNIKITSYNDLTKKVINNMIDDYVKCNTRKKIATKYNITLHLFNIFLKKNINKIQNKDESKTKISYKLLYIPEANKRTEDYENYFKTKYYVNDSSV